MLVIEATQCRVLWQPKLTKTVGNEQIQKSSEVVERAMKKEDLWRTLIHLSGAGGSGLMPRSASKQNLTKENKKSEHNPSSHYVEEALAGGR